MCNYKTAFILMPGLLILILSSLCLGADADLQDVVYLKNGSIIRGTIIEQIPMETLKIETTDGSVFVYQMSEIERIAKEKTPAKPPAPSLKSRKEPALAFGLAFFIPSAGQIYNGEYAKCGIYWGVTVVGMVMLSASIGDALFDENDDDIGALGTMGAVMILGAWGWSIVDAPLSASRINRENGLAIRPLPDSGLTLKMAPISVDGHQAPGLVLSWHF
jgi:hypothetical protein